MVHYGQTVTANGTTVGYLGDCWASLPCLRGGQALTPAQR